MNITQAGIGSGLELESIIEAFVTAESIPTEIRLQEKEDRLRTELSGLGSLKSALSTFQTVAEKLKSADALYKQSVTTSSDAIEVTTNGFATDGTFDIKVLQLAKANRLQTDNFASSTTTVGAGQLTFSSAAGETFNVTIDAADDLSAIRDKINADANNFGVNVTLVNAFDGTNYTTFLNYSSAKTGTENAISVSTADAALAGLATNATEVVTAQDAKITINDNLVVNSTNEFKNNIEDVTIVAKKVTGADPDPASAHTPATINITQDTTEASKLVNDFVAGFNELVENMIGLGAPVQGRLAFDADLRTLRGQFTSILMNNVAGLTGNIKNLGDMGIAFNKEGRLEISTVSTGSLESGATKLSNALKNDISGVGELFASSGGIVEQLTTLIDNYNNSDGTLTKRQTSLNTSLNGIRDEYQALEDKLRSYEDTLRKRFSFLDSTVAAYSATGDWLKTALTPINKER